MNTDKVLNNMLGKAKKNNNNFNTKQQLKPIKTTIIADKPVQVFNNHPIPTKQTIHKTYNKIPDDTSIPLQFMTRQQYVKKYVANQEKQNGTPFNEKQKQEFYKYKKDKYSNIIGRYTTKNNPYYKPAVVVFNDPENQKNIKGKKFGELAWHEYGHELAEREKIKLPTMKEEMFADKIAEHGMKKEIYNDIKTKNKVLQEIRGDKHSKNMAWKKPEPYDYVEEMTPREYLIKTNTPDFAKPRFIRNTTVDNKLTTVTEGPYKYEFEYYDKETEQMEPIQKLSEHIKSKDKEVEIPYVEPTGDHEGRHRAYAAELAGITKIPVKMTPPKSWRTKEIKEEFIEKAFPEQDRKYKSQWLERIDETFPEEKMDSKIREIYVNILKEKGLIKEDEYSENLTQSLWHAGDKPPSETLKEQGRVYGFSSKEFAQGWKEKEGKQNIYQFTADEYDLDQKTYIRDTPQGKKYSDNEYIVKNITGEQIQQDEESKDKITYRKEQFPAYNEPKEYKGKQDYKFRVLAKDNGDIKVLNFGHKDYEDYTTHKDKKRRDNFRARHKCDPVSKLGKLTPKFWSCEYLWGKD